MVQFKITFVAIVLLELLRLGESYLITIDARAQDCFHERVQAGTKLSKFANIVLPKKKNTRTKIEFVRSKVWCLKRSMGASTISSWKLPIQRAKSYMMATKRRPANTHSAQTRLACTRKKVLLFIRHSLYDIWIAYVNVCWQRSINDKSVLVFRRYCFVNEKGSMAPKTVMFTMDLGDAPRAAGAPNENEEGHTKLEDMVRPWHLRDYKWISINLLLHFRFANWAAVWLLWSTNRSTWVFATNSIERLTKAQIHVSFCGQHSKRSFWW